MEKPQRGIRIKKARFEGPREQQIKVVLGRAETEAMDRQRLEYAQRAMRQTLVPDPEELE